MLRLFEIDIPKMDLNQYCRDYECDKLTNYAILATFEI